MSQEHEKKLSRRNFLQSSLAAAAVSGAVAMPRPSAAAIPDGPLLRAGLVGCGGRGTGAARDIVKGAPNVKITALADVFQDRLNRARTTLEKEGQNVPDDHCFVGFDGYKKLIASDVDVVLLATPPHFRPAHFAAAVDARKHVFMEKPVAVDPVGIRSIIASGEKAKTSGVKRGGGNPTATQSGLPRGQKTNRRRRHRENRSGARLLEPGPTVVQGA